MTEFSSVREEKIEKISHRLEVQNNEAKKRNLTVLRDVGQELYKYSKLCVKLEDKSKDGGNAKLREAKLNYLHSIEKMLPVHRVNVMNQRLEKARKLHEMTEDVEKRRQLRMVLENEDSKAQNLLDQERRNYLLERSLQQKDELQINSRHLASKVQSQRADDDALQKVEKELIVEQQVFQNMIINSQKANDKTGSQGDNSLVKSSNTSVNADIVSQSPYDFLAASPSKGSGGSLPESPSSSLIRPSLSSEGNLQSLVTEMPKFDDTSNSQPGKGISDVDEPEYDITLSSPKRDFESSSPLAAISSSENTLEAASSSQMTSEYKKLSIPEYTKVLTAIFAYIDGLSTEENPSGTKLAYSQASSKVFSASEMRGVVDDVLTLEKIPAGTNPLKYAATSILVMQEIGIELFPSDSLNGVVTLDKIQKLLKRAGGGRSELLKCITDHLVAVVEKGKMVADEICTLFTSALVYSIDDSSEKNRVERKINKVLQLTALTNENSRSQSPPAFVGRDRMDVFTAVASASSGVESNDTRNENECTATHTYDDDEFEDLLDNEVLDAPPKVKDLFDEDQLGVGASEEDNDDDDDDNYDSH